MQHVIKCESCKKELVSVWSSGDMGRWLTLTGFQDPALDGIKVPNCPVQICASSIHIHMDGTTAQFLVFCPDCGADTTELILPQTIPPIVHTALPPAIPFQRLRDLCKKVLSKM